MCVVGPVGVSCSGTAPNIGCLITGTIAVLNLDNVGFRCVVSGPVYASGRRLCSGNTPRGTEFPRWLVDVAACSSSYCMFKIPFNITTATSLTFDFSVISVDGCPFRGPLNFTGKGSIIV